MEIYGVNLRIESEYRKIRTRKNFVFSHFSRRIVLLEMLFHFLFGDKGREEELKVIMKGKNLKNN